MNARERIHIALNHGEPDRVPYDLSGTTVTAITRNAYTKAMKYRGLSPESGNDEIDPIQQIVTPSETCLEYLGVDTRRIGAPRIFQYRQKRRRNGPFIEVTDFYGCDWKLEPGKDRYFNQATCPLGGSEPLSGSLQKLPRHDWDAYISDLRGYLDEQVKLTGDSCCIADRNTAGLTENSLRIRGYENWYMDTVLDLPGVEALLDIILGDKIRYWDAIADWAADTDHMETIRVASECDDLGSQTTTILDPDLLRKIVIPRLKILFTHIRKRLPHVKIFMHSCGAIRDLIPDLIDAGMDILNPVQFTAAGMDLRELKRDFGDAITFWGGGVDTQSTLNRGTPRQVRDEVRQIIDILAPGGGFVFAPVHNVQDDVPPENFWAMWDALQEFGKK